MPEGRLHQITQPSETELTEAIATFRTNPTSEQLVEAALVILGEACVQLGAQGKSQDEVVAFLTARGMTPVGAKGLVDQATEIIAAPVKNQTVHATPKRAHSWGLVLFGIVAVILAVYFLR